MNDEPTSQPVAQPRNVLEIFRTELATWEHHRDDLVRQAEGQWVLIYQSDVLGIFANERDAVSAGYRQLGLVPFLVQKIAEVDEVVQLPFLAD